MTVTMKTGEIDLHQQKKKITKTPVDVIAKVVQKVWHFISKQNYIYTFCVQIFFGVTVHVHLHKRLQSSQLFLHAFITVLCPPQERMTDKPTHTQHFLENSDFIVHIFHSEEP